jgi:serine/threonine protein kinase
MKPEAAVHSGACPSRDQIIALVSDEFNDAEAAPLEEHLESCAQCQQTLLDVAGSLDLAPLSTGCETAAPEADTVTEEPRADFLSRLSNLALLEPAPASAIERRLHDFSSPEIPGIDILEEIGRGSRGVVYLARQRSMNRLIALKIVPAERLVNEPAFERARRSIDTVGRLQHPNIIEVHQVGRHEGWYFGTLEFMEGGSLRDRLSGDPWKAREAAQLLLTLARAAAFVHKQGFVHRDLKPANVLFKADGTPKLADFGLARACAEDSNLTLDGEALGTPRYMAPEQAMGKSNLVPAVDVYALGAILYELLTGRPPFRGVTKLDTLYQVVHLPPVPVSRLQPGVPRDLARICMRCLEKVPEARYATATALADDLTRHLESRPLNPQPLGWMWRFRGMLNNHPVVSFFTVLLLLVAILEFIGMASLWLEVKHSNRSSQFNVFQQQIANLSNQLNRAQSELATSLPDLAEFEIKAGKKEKARTLLEKVPNNLRDARWEKLHAQCPETPTAGPPK